MSQPLSTPNRDSAIDDLRALAAGRSAVARDRFSDAGIYIAPSFPQVAPAVSVRAPRGSAVLVTLAVLALSTVALAAVPALMARPDASSREMVGATVLPADGLRHATAPSRTAASPIPSTSVSPEAPEAEPELETRAASRTTARRATMPRTATPAPLRPAPGSERASTEPTTSTLDDSLAAAVDSALAGQRAMTPVEALPTLPSSHDVSTALRALEREIAQCREGDGGIAAVRVALDGSTGRVSAVDVSGADDATACVARVVSTARVPRFAQEQLVVTFPYRL